MHPPRHWGPLALLLWSALPLVVWGEQVTLKSGGLLSGSVDRDNAIVSIFDGMKKTVLRDTRIASIDPEPSSARQRMERFTLVQPLEIHGGKMPSNALGIKTTPWDEMGQRVFQYSYYTDGGSLKTVRMRQAINELGPDYVRYRGIDGYWIGRLATSQIPREVVVGLLARVDQTNQNERLKATRFMIQAEWYSEALTELDRLAEDFPDLEATVANVRGVVLDLQARQILDEALQCLSVRQPKAAESLLRTFPTEEVSPEVYEQVQSTLQKIDAQAEADKALAIELRRTLQDLAPTDREAWRSRTFELLRGLSQAPDAAGPRLSAFRDLADDTSLPPAERLAVALTGWVVGAEQAAADLATAEALWNARDVIARYLAGFDESERYALLDQLQAIESTGPESEGTKHLDLETATRLVRHLPPSLATAANPEPGKPLIHRVIDEVNRTPTEYHLLLPPEYHPLRSYPAVVALHAGQGPRQALDWWGPEAARNGYIVIAPEYNRPDQKPDYRYTSDEHAAVELAVRDARKRYAIDSNRIFLGGQVLGGNMAWDLGLAQPDLWAGVVSVSGLPMKYVSQTRNHVEFVPLYVAIGDLSTAATDVLVFDLVKALISKTWDVTYVEYYRRGLEDLPEEAPVIFDWMNRRQREPYVKDFEVKAGRASDDRFFGVVVRDFVPGRTTVAEVVDPLGRNLNPATIKRRTSTLGNLVSLTVSGVRRLDLWLGPEFLNFDEKLQIRVNGKRLFHDVVEPDLSAFLEDLRIRGDREQVYWAKISLE